MTENRGSLYLLTGLLFGLALGLVYSLFVQPVRFTNTAPSSLDANNKDLYRALIASAFTADYDLVRAQARLALLKDNNPYEAIAEQAQRWLAAGHSIEEARALGYLAAALQQPGFSLPVSPSPTQSTSQPAIPTTLAPPTNSAAGVLVPTATLTQTTLTVNEAITATIGIPPAGKTPTPTTGTAFLLNKKNTVCQPGAGQGLIQVMVKNAAGQQLSGMEVIVSWKGGENHFFTGLKPDQGQGYADFNMSAGFSYVVRMAAGGEPVNDLTIPQCSSSSGGSYPGNWLLEFVRP